MMQNNIFSRAKYDDERNKYGQLLAVGIVISYSAGGISTSVRYIRATQVFTRLIVTSITFFRLLPGNPITHDRNEHWDWPAVASIARNILEAYLIFFYIGIDDISEVEINFRLSLLQFHSNSEKYKLFKSGPKSLDLIDFEANLAKDKKCLKEHLFFVHLKKNHQDRALSGKHATYMTRRELIARLPFSTDELNWIYRHVSNEVHTTAFAFSSQSRERGRGDENLAERAYTINAIWLVRKYLAAAILGMKQMFPKEIGGGKAMEVQIAKEHFDDAM